ncbi:hypothetical protein DF220_12120 [Salinibacterium hongtaonis]|uniref:Uncharacterized protein n=1 Tax=Homoserinimonas hongtaonis TaxID=2079791 RepID=A0A2U1SWW5_9MICO|nr:hypothetical protein DF220_12120 [Salinibacterium hongtaonis]
MRRDFGGEQAGIEGASPPPQLGCDGGPCRVVVSTMQVKTVQAGGSSRLHKRTEPNGLVAEHHRKVRNIAPKPLAALARHRYVVRDDHGDRGALGGRLPEQSALIEGKSQTIRRDAHSRHHNAVRVRRHRARHKSGGEHAEKGVDVVLRYRGGVGDETQRRSARAADKCGEQAFLRIGHAGHHHRGAIHPDLQAIGAAPDEGESGVDSQGHAVMMEHSAGQPPKFSTRRLS